MKIRVFVATLAPPAASSLVVLALWHWSVTIFEIQAFSTSRTAARGRCY